MKLETNLKVLKLGIAMDSFFGKKQIEFIQDAKIASDKYTLKQEYLRSIYSGYLDIRGMARALAEELTVEEFQELNEYIQLRHEEARIGVEAEYKLLCLRNR